MNKAQSFILLFMKLGAKLLSHLGHEQPVGIVMVEPPLRVALTDPATMGSRLLSRTLKDRLWEWGTTEPPPAYLQQCGTAGKNLCHARLAAGRGSQGKVCLWCWVPLSSLALCPDLVPPHH